MNPLDANPNLAQPSPKLDSEKLGRDVKIATKNILFLGDSNTDWGRTRDSLESWTTCVPLKPIGFVGQIQNLRDELGNQKYSVLNRGFSGAKVEDLVSRIEQHDGIETESLRGAGVIVVAIGINDVVGGTSPAAFRESYSKLLELVKSNNLNASMILLTPYLLNNKLPGLTSYLQDVIGVIEDEGQKHGVNSVVNLQSSLKDVKLNDYVMPYHDAASGRTIDPNDGIHPSYEGHTIIANELKARLDALN